MTALVAAANDEFSEEHRDMLLSEQPSEVDESVRLSLSTLSMHAAQLHSKQGSFQDFMGDMGKALASTQDSKVDDGKVDEDLTAPAQASPTFSTQHRRLAHFSSTLGVEQRAQRSGGHRMLYGDNLQWCTVCAGTFQTELKKGSRHAGSRTHFACLDCGEVKLCKQRVHRLGDIITAGFTLLHEEHKASDADDDDDSTEDRHNKMVSCWDLWHSVVDVGGLQEFLFRQAKTTQIQEWTEKAKEIEDGSQTPSVSSHP
jgi:hypothetical protein